MTVAMENQQRPSLGAWLSPVHGSPDIKLRIKMNGKTTIGRGRTCDIVIQSAGMLVSRRHIIITHLKIRDETNAVNADSNSLVDTFTLTENCSLNGTMINNTRLLAASTRTSRPWCT